MLSPRPKIPALRLITGSAAAQVLHAAIIADPGSGQSKGFGFVHFPDAPTASMAAQAMNRKQARSPPHPSPQTLKFEGYPKNLQL